MKQERAQKKNATNPQAKKRNAFSTKGTLHAQSLMPYMVMLPIRWKTKRLQRRT